MYEMKDAPLVQGLTRQPVVAQVHSGTSSSCFGTAKPDSHDAKFPDGWECATAPWFNNASLLHMPYAQSGPKDWKRVDIKNLAQALDTALPSVAISNLKTTVDKISFHVSRPGVPVVVKESYFPNW